MSSNIEEIEKEIMEHEARIVYLRIIQMKALNKNEEGFLSRKAFINHSNKLVKIAVHIR